MDILLVAGKYNNILYYKIAYKKFIINKQSICTSQLLDLILDESIQFDQILILDEGIDESMDDFLATMEQIGYYKEHDKIFIATSNLEIKMSLTSFKIYLNEDVRPFDTFYSSCLEEIVAKGQTVNLGKAQEETKETKKTKGSIFRKVFSRNKVVADEEDKGFKHVSQGISRVIGITGHRGVGITSTLVNLAYEASNHNLKTIVVNLDIYNRTTNLYFGEFIRQTEQDEDLRASLIKCLAKPQDYERNACCIKNKLWLAELAYDFDDERLINQFYTSSKLINMLTVLRQHFNVILLDIPLEILGEFEGAIVNIDVFGLCTNNSQYSIITNLRNMDHYLSAESIGYLNAKSKLIITRYNDRAQYEHTFFTPDKVSEIYHSDLCEELSIKMPVAGQIKYTNEFDEQIANDIPIVEQNSEYKKYYSNVLLRLLEATR